MEPNGYLPALIGGVMMGLAVVLLLVLLANRSAEGGSKESRKAGEWALVLAFIVSVPIGALAMSRLFGKLQSGSIPLMLVVGGLVGLAALLLARKSARRGG